MNGEESKEIYDEKGKKRLTDNRNDMGMEVKRGNVRWKLTCIWGKSKIEMALALPHHDLVFFYKSIPFNYAFSHF